MKTDDQELLIFAADERTARRPGETLELSAMWSLPKPPRDLEARLLWYTRSKGTEDVGVEASERVTAPAAAGERTFRFKLPNGPYSFSGQFITLAWAVELVADGRASRWEFTLGPDGREVALDPTHAARV